MFSVSFYFNINLTVSDVDNEYPYLAGLGVNYVNPCVAAVRQASVDNPHIYTCKYREISIYIFSINCATDS